MKRKFLTVIAFLLCVAYTNVNAQMLTGCGKTGTSQIYYQQAGFGVGTGNTSKPRYQGAFSTLTTNTAICPRFTSFTLKQPTTLCCIGTDCATNNFLYDFTNIPCPIDDHVWAMLLFAGFAGIFALKKMQSPQAI